MELQALVPPSVPFSKIVDALIKIGVDIEPFQPPDPQQEFQNSEEYKITFRSTGPCDDEEIRPNPRVPALPMTPRIRSRVIMEVRNSQAGGLDLARILGQAMSQRRPLLIKKALDLKKFSFDDLKTLPKEIKIREKSGEDPIPLNNLARRGAARLAKNLESYTAASPAKRMKLDRDEGPSTPHILSSHPGDKSYMDKLLHGEETASFREASGLASMMDVCKNAFPRAKLQSINLFATAPGCGRSTKAHVDDYDNVMLVCSGKKSWAIANLPSEKFNSARRLFHDTARENALATNPFAIGSITDPQDFELAREFDFAWVEPGDIIFNPASWTHMVLSDSHTLAYSWFYESPDGVS